VQKRPFKAKFHSGDRFAGETTHTSSIYAALNAPHLQEAAKKGAARFAACPESLAFLISRAKTSARANRFSGPNCAAGRSGIGPNFYYIICANKVIWHSLFFGGQFSRRGEHRRKNRYRAGAGNLNK